MKKIWLLASLCLGLAAYAQADDAPANIQAADTAPASLSDLDQRVRVVERLLENQKDDAAAKSAAGSIATSEDKDGLSFKSSDGKFKIAIKDLIQADSRTFFDDLNQKTPEYNNFTIKRARAWVDGTLFGNTDYRVLTDFGGGTAAPLQDAYLNFAFLPWLKLKGGKFTSPVSLVRIQSSGAQRFTEFGFAGDLAPNRDLGFDLNGWAWTKDFLTYDVAIVGGAQDGASIDATPNQNDRDFAGRIFIQPFNSTDIAPLQKLGLGIAGTYGNRSITAAVSPSAIKSIGQNSLFSYSANLVETGQASRVDPQGWWYWNNIGVLGEWIRSANYAKLAALPDKEYISNEAFEVQALWAITGEDETYGQLKPLRSWDPANGSFGALELAGRYGEFRPDQDLFYKGNYANPTASPTKAQDWGVALNWYLNPAVVLIADWEQTWYQGGGGGTLAAPKNLEQEKVLFTRLQLSY